MSSRLNLTYFGILILAWLIADLCGPFVIGVSRRLGALDKPGGHKAQRKPVPFLGGVSIFCALSAAIAVSVNFSGDRSWLPLAGIPIGGVFVLVLGLLDDWRPVNAVTKLLLLFLASLVVVAFGIRATLLPSPWGIVPNIVISMLWIAGTTSALNSLDNTDGVAGGVTAVAAAGVCAMYAIRTDIVDQPYLLALSCALMGACFGFLRYNWPKAQMYLGDNGSFFLGFTLGCMLLFARWTEDPVRSALLPPVLLTVPLLDLVLSTVLRYTNGVVKTIREAIVHCDHDHLAHRLQALGMTRTEAAVTLWVIAGICAVETVVMCEVRSLLLFWTLLAGHAAFVAVISAILAKAPVHGKKSRNRKHNGRSVIPPDDLCGEIHSHLPLLLHPAGGEEHDPGFRAREAQRENEESIPQNAS